MHIVFVMESIDLANEARFVTFIDLWLLVRRGVVFVLRNLRELKATWDDLLSRPPSILEDYHIA
jgi:hypothetical protein